MKNKSPFYGALLAIFLTFSCATAWSQTTATFTFSGTITGGTCAISTPNLNFPMGTVDKHIFTGIGIAQPTWTTQNFTYTSCDARLVSMTFAGTAAPGTLHAFATTGTAQGVGIQLFNQGGTFQMYPNDATHAFTFVPVATGGSVQFNARYIQTGATVTSGSANLSIAVTITYT